MATLLGGRGERAGEAIITEASGGDGRAEMERRLIQRSLEDGALRQRLLDDPWATAARRGAHGGRGEDAGYRLPRASQHSGEGGVE
jgi:hypothetical protein